MSNVVKHMELRRGKAVGMAVFLCLAIVAGFVLSAPSAHAQTATFDVADGDWDQDSNWDTAQFPNDPSDIAIIPRRTPISPEVTLNTSVALSSLQFPNAASTVTLQVSNSSTFTIYSSITSTISSASASISPEVILPNDITIEVSGSAFKYLEFRGGISGSGGIIKSGPGRLRLTNVQSTYSGTTYINEGSVEVGSYDPLLSLNSPIVLANASGVFLNVQTDQTIPSLSGGGPLGGDVHLGPGPFIPANLTVGDATDTTFAGVISLWGNVVKQGSGKLTLTGDNTYTGTTTVAAGTLAVNGSIGGMTTTVNSGAKLQGVGSLTDVEVEGALAAGNSIGVINGDSFTFADGSTLENELDTSGNSDLLNATTSVTIEPGATLKIMPTAGTYPIGQKFIIISAPTVTGTFSNVINTLDGVHFRVNYYADRVELEVIPASVDPLPAAASVTSPQTGFGTPSSPNLLLPLIVVASVAFIAIGSLIISSQRSRNGKAKT